MAVLAKRSESFSVTGVLAVGVDRILRDFEPMRWQVHIWTNDGIPSYRLWAEALGDDSPW